MGKVGFVEVSSMRFIHSEIGQIPETWKIKTISEISKVVDSLHQTPIYADKGYPMVRVTDIKEGGLNLDNCLKVSDEVYNLFTKNHEPQLGDIVISRVGTYGVFSYVNTSERFCLGQNTAIISPRINRRYLYYNFINSRTKHQIENVAVGSTQKTISLKNIKAIKIPVCCDNEQKAIADILSCLDDKIELNNRINKTLEEVSQAIFKSWFVDFEPFQDGEFEDSELGRIPKGWRIGTLSEICSVLSGGTPKTGIDEYWDGGIPFFSPKDVLSSSYVLKTEKTITEKGLNACNTRLYPKDTVFITARGTVGKVVLAGCDMAMNQSCYALKGKDGIEQYFLFLTTMNSIQQIKKSATGAVFDAIVVKTFDTIEIIIPPVNVVNNFSAICNSLFQKILVSEKQNQILIEIRDFLLPKLMSGEIRVPLEEVQ